MTEDTSKDDVHAVVTGGAGFVGSHLVDELLADGYRVTVLDNLGSGRRSNLEHISSDHLTLEIQDIRNPLPSFDRIDEVYHLASRASPTDFRSHAVEIALTNSEGTNNVLSLASEHDARILLASTSEVYGDPKVHPQPETYNGNVNPRGPRAPYDEGKRFAEALASAYEQQYGLDIRTVRIFNTYGPRMSRTDGRVIPTFLDQALRGEDLTIHGDGSQTRSFCYVSDLVRGLRRMAAEERSDLTGEVVNLGSTAEISIRSLAETTLEVVDSESSLTFEERPPDDPEVRRPDIGKARELLDWEPTIPLEEGLERTVEAFTAR